MGLAARLRDRWIGWTIAIVAVTSVYATTVALTGGFKIALGGLRFPSREWQRPAAVAIIGAIVLAVAARARIAAASSRLAIAADSPRFARWMAAVGGVSALAAGIGFGTFASGGADSYGYVGQARLLAEGRLTDTIP